MIKIKCFAMVFTIAAALLSTGCDKPPQYRTILRMDNICATESSDKRAAFTLTCIDSANPKSDEEPEDWILLCEKMATDTYCQKTTVTVDQVKLKGSWWKDISVKTNTGNNNG